MARIVRRPRAQRDLLQTWDYIASESGLDRADDYLRGLEIALRNLAAHPQLGRARPELADALRSFPFEGHVILYLPAHGWDRRCSRDPWLARSRCSMA